MPNLDMKWEEGDVGDFFLTVGKKQKVGHVYQTPWTGQLWTAEAAAFGIPATVFDTKLRAQVEVEMAVTDWIEDALYSEPPQDDLIWFNPDFPDTII